MRTPSDLHGNRIEPPSNVARATPSQEWSAAQTAAVAAAEAIAATAAAEVADEAAATAQAAVDVASAAAVKAAVKASEVAAQAVLAAAAAAIEIPSAAVAHESSVDVAMAVTAATTDLSVLSGDDHAAGIAAGQEDAVDAAAAAAATAAAKVAVCVAAVAAAAATAAAEAAALIGDQLARDVAAAAAAVSCASAHSIPPEDVQDLTSWCGAEQADDTDCARSLPVLARDIGQRLAGELRLGIDAGQLRLHYQPIMCLGTGEPVSVEALVRWQHPQRGLLEPLEFIELAERSGLIIPLGAWVLHEACRVAVSLQARGDKALTVAVNLSAPQLSDRGIVDTVRAALDAHGCGADRLVFEITETALVTDMSAAIDSLRALHELGAGLAIDDFCTGYSSLLYLKNLPADTIKIDRSFVSGLGGDSHDSAIVASLISLAHNLDIGCVAEGVETLEQLELLEQFGCDLAQGYLFSRPVDAVTLERWLDQRRGKSPRRPVPASPGSRNETARIVAMHEDGSSLHTIAAALNIEGSQTIHGRRWSAQTVAQIVSQTRLTDARPLSPESRHTSAE